jgi:hypothetical protein
LPLACQAALFERSGERCRINNRKEKKHRDMNGRSGSIVFPTGERR